MPREPISDWAKTRLTAGPSNVAVASLPPIFWVDFTINTVGYSLRKGHLVSGLHQGQRPIVPRKQTEQMTASDRSESDQVHSCIAGAIHR